MQYLRQIEDFVEIGFELGLFIIVMTIAITQVIAPYARTIVQRGLLRSLTDDNHWVQLRHLIRSKTARSVLQQRYPFLAKAMAPKLDLPGQPSRLLEHAHVGVSDKLLMRVVQNVAQAAVERPGRDPVSYAALTADADDADRLGGIVVDAISASELARSVQRAELSSGSLHRDGDVPSEVALEATAVRTNLAAVVERKLDEMQVQMAVRWQLTGRFLAIAIGAMSAIYVALASNAIAATPILRLAALAPVVFVVLGSWYSGWVESRLAKPGYRRSRFVSSGILDALLAFVPFTGFLLGLAILQMASGNEAVALVVFGAVAGLIASVLYDAAKAFSRRR